MGIRDKLQCVRVVECLCLRSVCVWFIEHYIVLFSGDYFLAVALTNSGKTASELKKKKVKCVSISS